MRLVKYLFLQTLTGREVEGKVGLGEPRRGLKSEKWASQKSKEILRLAVKMSISEVEKALS